MDLSMFSLEGRSAIHEMAKEPRFHRRMLSDHIAKAIKSFPESPEKLVRKMSFLPSFYKGKGYVFLQLKAIGLSDNEEEYRPNSYQYHQGESHHEAKLQAMCHSPPLTSL